MVTRLFALWSHLGQNNSGGGATFSFALPIHRIQRPWTEQDINEQINKIFAVDDDASVRKSLAHILRSAGYHVETFANAAEFLAQMRVQETPGCLVLDIQLPGLSGLELDRELHGGFYQRLTARSAT